MSVVTVAVLLAGLLLLLLRTHQVGIGSALVAVIFGLVLGSTPVGPSVNQSLNQAGGWAWVQVNGL